MSALGGLPVRDGMAGLATGNREGKPADREQETYTPIEIIEVVETVGERIVLDPCSGPGSIVPALVQWMGEQRQKRDVRGNFKWCRLRAEDCGVPRPMLEWTGRGLTDPWTVPGESGIVYVNPPYVDLEEWLAKSRNEAAQGVEIILLGPVRPHRVWWCDAWESADAKGWLWPVTFGGHVQSFPAPLALWYWGPRADWFTEVFEASGLGRIVK